VRDIDSLLGFGETEDELEMKSDDDDDDHSGDENDSSSATDQAGRRSHLRDDRSTDSVRRARYSFIVHRVSEKSSDLADFFSAPPPMQAPRLKE